MSYETVIGLEVHIELNTKSKMFCRCQNVSLCDEPNRHICPVCLGLVGALPLINEKAVESTIRVGLALGCAIAAHSKWDRKNYFYPDLPKAYQISQFDLPLCFAGKISVFNKESESVGIGINRVHLEEDAAKLIHHDNETWVDFNRSGLPLIEIVTEPDIRSIEDAEALLKELRRLVRYIGVSDADMEKGQLRCDASISLRPMGETKLFPRVEIKNLNSFKAVVKALTYEKARLEELWDKSEPPSEASTVLWDEEKSETRFMRDKEDAADYRYCPEPDVPELKIDPEYVNALKAALQILPGERIRQFVSKGLDLNRAESIAEDSLEADFLSDLIDLSGGDNDLCALSIKKFLEKSSDCAATSSEFFELAKALYLGKISGLQYKEILESDSVESELKKALKNSVEIDLDAEVNEIISANPSVVNEYLEGKEKAINVLIGKVIQKTGGKVSAPKILEALKVHLQIL